MNKPSTLALKYAIEKAGSAWIFRYWGNDLSRNLDRIRKELEQFSREYQHRFGETPDPFALLEENPVKGAAFFQIDTFMVSLEMKIMIWRILLGCEIAKIKFNYEAGKAPELTVVLRPPYGEREEVYKGQMPSDFRVLRHFGATGVSGELFLQGYYAGRAR